MIGGDFNARCGLELDDYIPGVDDQDFDIPPRVIIDSHENKFGQWFSQFCIDANACCLNGRFDQDKDNFTCFHPSGQSVVDYCLVPYRDFTSFSNFQVLPVSSLVPQIIDLGIAIPESSMPDHAILSWTFSTEIQTSERSLESEIPTNNIEIHPRLSFKEIPPNFMSSEDILNEIEETISKLEATQSNQIKVDVAYEQYCNLISRELKETDLIQEHKTQQQQTNKKNSHQKTKWWSPFLAELWHKQNEKEKCWRKCPSNDRTSRSRLKEEYKETLKHFKQEVRKAKRKIHLQIKDDLLNLHQNNSPDFWKEIGRLGLASERNRRTPVQVKIDDTISSDPVVVLQRWMEDFSNLFSKKTPSDNIQVDEVFLENTIKKLQDLKESLIIESDESHWVDSMTDDFYESINKLITKDEVTFVVNDAALKKAYGYDLIHNKVLKTDASIRFLHSLFNFCFKNGVVPSMWLRGIIHPIPKDSKLDQTEPLNHRGISLLSCVMKLYCKILNIRLTTWAEKIGSLAEEQNGFRAMRSCIDHCFSLISIIKNRLSLGLSTHCCFVDFQKAFDSVNHDCLWFKLLSLNLHGRMFQSIQALYTDSTSAVRLNGMLTDWFPIEKGVKQGCLLSPLLFALYVNDLIIELNAIGKGIKIDSGSKICCLFYADDIVLIAESEEDLQLLLDKCHVWCQEWRMFVNKKKTNVVHFRSKSTPKSSFSFTFGPLNLETKDQYVYLGILLTEHLDLEKAANRLSAASRALGFLCAKSRMAGGFPISIYEHLYHSMIVPIMDYGAEILGVIGLNQFNTVHNRACRSFLGVSRKTANAVVQGELGWTLPVVRRKTAMIRYWNRVSKMDASRIPSRIFNWNQKICSRKCQNWCFHSNKILEEAGLVAQARSQSRCDLSDKDILSQIYNSSKTLEINAWHAELNRIHGVRSKSHGNKLRTYRTLKSSFESEKYLSLITHRGRRATYAKLFDFGDWPLQWNP
eukprot:Lithocolla_globosa_v1_NODE_782_length_3286_cov_3.792634.p1 type:complete len:976 gc:universal NODE_782_length_3286_cov_3.792634:2974-47(-)